MRLKKGFTLAEILIVLMVIGALATMTIPSLMRGVQEAQWKTAYKKAYNAMVNLTAMEKIAGNLPSSADAIGVSTMYNSLTGSLSIKDYVASTDAAIGHSAAVTTDKYQATSPAVSGTTSPWIISEDNIAYAVTAPASGTCGSKADINAATSEAAARSASCVVIAVDVNGLSNQPNKLDNKLGSITSSGTLPALTGDRFYIYIGSDGATAGPKQTTITGRIAADLK